MVYGVVEPAEKARLQEKLNKILELMSSMDKAASADNDLVEKRFVRGLYVYRMNRVVAAHKSRYIGISRKWSAGDTEGWEKWADRFYEFLVNSSLWFREHRVDNGHIPGVHR